MIIEGVDQDSETILAALSGTLKITQKFWVLILTHSLQTCDWNALFAVRRHEIQEAGSVLQEL